MLIVAGSMRIKPEARDRFFEAVKPMVEATLEEPGCQTYAFSPDPFDTGIIHLHELWDSREDLDLHFASDHMATWRSASAELPILERNLAIYGIGEVTPLP